MDKEYRLPRKDALTMARVLNKNRDKKFRLMEFKGRVILTDWKAVSSQGYEDLGLISWSLLKEELNKSKLTQKEVEDLLYKMYNSKNK